MEHKVETDSKNVINKRKRNKNQNKICNQDKVTDIKPHEQMKVERVLPEWLCNPIPIARDLNKNKKSPQEVWPQFNSDLINILKKDHINYFFPVQQVVIPQILRTTNGVECMIPPRDFCVATPTGSGKTLAYVLPIVQALGVTTYHFLSAIVVLPVIELAKQVSKVFRKYASVFNLTVCDLFGESTFESEQENLLMKFGDEYYSKVDIVVALPGRLKHHIYKTEGLDFSTLRFLVLDEADKLLVGENGVDISEVVRHAMSFKPRRHLNFGFFSPYVPLEDKNHVELSAESENSQNISPTNTKADLKSKFFASPFIRENEIVRTEKKNEEYPVPCPPLQKLLFSATLTHDPDLLQNMSLFIPMLFTINSENEDTATNFDTTVRPSELYEEWVYSESSVKPLVLHHILRKERKKHDNFKSLVFTSSIELASKIAIILKSLSSGKYQVEIFTSKLKYRKERLSQFRKGKINVLVATDAMARGIDVPDVNCVISYDVTSSNTYTHRVGRAARAGKPGKAVSIVTDGELKQFKRIMGKNFNDTAERIVKQEKLQRFESAFKDTLSLLTKELEKRDGREKKISKTLHKKKNLNKRIHVNSTK